MLSLIKSYKIVKIVFKFSNFQDHRASFNTYDSSFTMLYLKDHFYDILRFSKIVKENEERTRNNIEDKIYGLKVKEAYFYS